MLDEFTEWKASQARPWAEQVLSDSRRVQQRRELLEQWQEQMISVSGIAYDKPSVAGSASDDSMVERIARKTELERELLESIAECEQQVREFMAALRRIDGLSDALLTARYVRGMTWAKVAKATGYSEVHVKTHLATMALAALYDEMPHDKRPAIPKAL